MQVTLTIPDDLAAQYAAAGKDPSRAALEALAVEGYRTQRLTESEVKRMLGYGTACRSMRCSRNTTCT